jgi:hypothetical protein
LNPNNPGLSSMESCFEIPRLPSIQAIHPQ